MPALRMFQVRQTRGGTLAIDHAKATPLCECLRVRYRARTDPGHGGWFSMTDTIIKPTIREETRVQRPRLHKVILVNDDFTPREFVVVVLKAEFRMSEDQASRVMMTAHRRGSCVVAVYTKDVAEEKATRATDAGRSKGYPLLFTTEPEE